MRLQVGTCLLLLVGLLTTPTPGTGAPVDTGDVRTRLESGADTDPAGDEPTAERPLWKTGPESSGVPSARTGSPEVGGSQVSSVQLEEVSAIPAEPQPNTSPGVAQQAGAPQPSDELGPLLNLEELLALDAERRRRTRPPTSNSGTTSVPVPVTASAPPEADKDFTSQLAEVIKSILNESPNRGEPTTQRPRQPPSVDTSSQKPPLCSTGDTAKFDKFLPQLQEALKSVLAKHKPEDLQLPPTIKPLLPQTPKVPDTEEDLKHILPTLEEAIGSILQNSEAIVPFTTSRPELPPIHPTKTDIKRPSLLETEEDLKHILPTLEEAIGSILKNSEAKIPVTTSRPELPPIHPTKTDIKRPSLLETEEDLKHILPTLEEAIGSILKNSEAKIPVTTSQPELPPIHPTKTDIKRPSLLETEEDLKHILPTLEEAIGSILNNSEAKIPVTTSQQELPPTHPTKTDIKRPSLLETEEDLKHILPTLEEAIGDILKNSEAKVTTTTSRPVPALALVCPTTPDSRKQFAAVLPQLEAAIRIVLDEAVKQQEAAAQQHTTPPSVGQPSPPTIKDYGFDKFLPELERVFGDILLNRESDYSATVTNTTAPTNTVKTPILPVKPPMEEKPSFQSNVIESDSPSSQSESLFQTVKSILQDVFNNQEVKAATPWMQP